MGCSGSPEAFVNMSIGYLAGPAKSPEGVVYKKKNADAEIADHPVEPVPSAGSKESTRSSFGDRIRLLELIADPVGDRVHRTVPPRAS